MGIFFRQVETKCNWQSIISPISSALAIVADEGGVFWQALSELRKAILGFIQGPLAVLLQLGHQGLLLKEHRSLQFLVPRFHATRCPDKPDIIKNVREGFSYLEGRAL
jgi:hypothetical protein